MKNTFKSFVAFAALSVTTFTAYAGVASSYSDLVLGFTDGTTNVLVNIGNINQYTTAAATQTIASYGSLLSTAFGTSNFSSLSWGIIGNAGQAGVATNGDPVRTVWVTNPWDNTKVGVLGLQNSVAYDRSSIAVASASNAEITSVYQSLAIATAGETNVALKAVTLTNNVWDVNAPFLLVGDFSHTIGDVALGQTYSASDLYTIRTNGVRGSPEGAQDSQFNGTFSISSAGVLTFTVIPEPSTYAMILGIAILGFAAIRHRKQAILLA